VLNEFKNIFFPPEDWSVVVAIPQLFPSPFFSVVLSSAQKSTKP
jgi:hypothetical protein